jgi:GDP-L-fucose synthase
LPDTFDLTGRKVFVAGSNGMVGRALIRRLEREPVELLTAPRTTLDLTDPAATDAWLQAHRPDIVIISAARVGGIHANRTFPVDFLEDNLLIQTNLMRSSHRAGVDRLLFLGSSCIYPRDCPQPIREEYLLTGPLEPTNDAYALAKIAGLRLVRAYREQHGRSWIAAMPTNLYGPFDNFHPETSHALPALIRRFHEAVVSGFGTSEAVAVDRPQVAETAVGRSAHPTVTVWGSGNPRREFLHVDDLADASVHLLRHYDDPTAINVGTGSDLTIRELAEAIAVVTRFEGSIAFDATRPDGTPRKLLDTSRLTAQGWRPSITLDDGLASTYAWFRDHAAQARGVRQQGRAA